MATERVADMTVEDLTAIIAEVVAQQFTAMKTSLLQEISDLIDSKGRTREPAKTWQDTYVLPKRTPEEQRQRNQAAIELLRKWVEEGDEEEQRETFEYLQKALDEDRLSNRPLFPKQ